MFWDVADWMEGTTDDEVPLIPELAYATLEEIKVDVAGKIIDELSQTLIILLLILINVMETALLLVAVLVLVNIDELWSAGDTDEVKLYTAVVVLDVVVVVVVVVVR